jgi:hypothetical protein
MLIFTLIGARGQNAAKEQSEFRTKLLEMARTSMSRL